MSEIIGSFSQPRQELQVESLSLRFSPSSIPLKQRWRNNGLSADFLADYVTTFFPRVEDDPASEARRGEVQGAVNFRETNTVGPKQAAVYRAFINRLVASDPNEMYLEQLEKSVDGDVSGLGFLTMINDYAATLAWMFEATESGAVTVTTHVALAI